MRGEVKAVINTLKERKTPGPDWVHSEFLKLLGDESVTFLTSIFNNIDNTGNTPKDGLISEIIMLPKSFESHAKAVKNNYTKKMLEKNAISYY